MDDIVDSNICNNKITGGFNAIEIKSLGTSSNPSLSANLSANAVMPSLIIL